MFDYNKSKKIALALKNSIYTEGYTNWVDDSTEFFNCPPYAAGHIVERHHFLECIRFAENGSSDIALLSDYFKLFNINVSFAKKISSNPYFNEACNISPELFTYLKQFDLLIGISSDFFGYGQIDYSFPLRNYQLLLYLLIPFRKIGLVPVKPSTYKSDSHVIISIPYDDIYEFNHLTSAQLVIPAESVLKLISYPDTARIFQDYDVIDCYWSSSNQNSFVEYAISNYIKNDRRIND